MHAVPSRGELAPRHFFHCLVRVAVREKLFYERLLVLLTIASVNKNENLLFDKLNNETLQLNLSIFMFVSMKRSATACMHLY